MDTATQLQMINQLNIDNEIKINLRLVINKARPAFLFEIANHERESWELVEQELNEIFMFTVESYLPKSDLPWRVFIHTDPLPKQTEDREEWIAECLGFFQKGIPLDDGKICSLHFYCDDVNFYTEIIEISNIDIEAIEERRKSFSDALGDDMSVSYKIEEIYSFIDLVNDYYDEKYDRIFKYLDGCGISYWNDVSYCSDVSKVNRTRLWFDMSFAYIGVFDEYFPLSLEQDKYFAAAYQKMDISNGVEKEFEKFCDNIAKKFGWELSSNVKRLEKKLFALQKVL